MECLTKLVGVKELCTTNAVQPLFYLDDAEGLDRVSLSQLAKASNGSGLAFGKEIIESASRFLMADIESLVPKGYSIKSSLNSFCNTCTYTGMSSGTQKTGIVVKNISSTKNGFLSIDSLKVMIASTGKFTIVLDDGIAPKQIPYDFTAGTEVVITNIGFKSASKVIKIYFSEVGVLVTALNCPVTKSCGCSGRKADSSTDITVKGLLNDVEFNTQYAFIPCASIVCSLENIMCNIVNIQPRLFALALFYRSAARYFSEFQVTTRNNRSASYDEEEKLSLADRYIALYYERLRGSENVKGIADNMMAALNNLNDPCIECSRKTSVAWAIS
jgi:hypothetical protein